MENIIINLEVIKALSKDLHYILKGQNFYGNHLLMDRIQEDMQGFIDDIKENYFMFRGWDVPLNKDIFSKVADILSDIQKDSNIPTINELTIQLKNTIYFIESYIRDNEDELTAGDMDLLGRISSNLQKSFGLIQHII